MQALEPVQAHRRHHHARRILAAQFREAPFEGEAVEQSGLGVVHGGVADAPVAVRQGLGHGVEALGQIRRQAFAGHLHLRRGALLHLTDGLAQRLDGPLEPVGPAGGHDDEGSGHHGEHARGERDHHPDCRRQQRGGTGKHGRRRRGGRKRGARNEHGQANGDQQAEGHAPGLAELREADLKSNG